MKHLIASAFLLAASCATIPAATAEDRFFQRLSSLCGKAFEGRIASPPVEADAAFAGKSLVMHVRDCSADEIRIPFHVGEDRSRTWVITRTGAGLRLKHDHRHQDGSEDKLSQYGGDTVGEGSAARQAFPADRFSKELFMRENIPASTQNIWAMEAEPGRSFAYELRRPGRFFRVEFDLTRPVAAPPPPWEHANPLAPGPARAYIPPTSSTSLDVEAGPGDGAGGAGMRPAYISLESEWRISPH